MHRRIGSPHLDPNRSVGHLCVAWIEHFVVHGPGDVQGEPVRVTPEMYDFIVDCYAVDERGRLLHDSGFFSRPKGCDKSGLAGRLVLFEALGPCRATGEFARGGEVYRDPWGLGFAYTDQPGEPLARPVKAPFVRILATEEGQTGNTYDTVHLNLTDDAAPLSRVPGVDCGLTRVHLPGGGEITPSTASSSSKDGGKETFAVFDETHLYTTGELRRMYSVVARNLRKRKKIAGSWFIESTTMYEPSEESVAEQTFKLADAIEEGRSRQQRLLFDHRWGECDDLADEPALRQAIIDAYGDAIEWNDLDGIVAEFYDPRASTSNSRRYFLNAPTSTADAYVEAHQWAARSNPTRIVADRERITLGFDGSRRRSYGVTDATALIGCTLDGHVFELGVWEQPSGPAGDNWQVPVEAVKATVRAAFDRFDVVGFYADPAKFETVVAEWEADYGGRLKVKASRSNPIEWWVVGGRGVLIARAVEQFHGAIIDGEMTHSGESALTRHTLNVMKGGLPRWQPSVVIRPASEGGPWSSCFM